MVAQRLLIPLVRLFFVLKQVFTPPIPSSLHPSVNPVESCSIILNCCEECFDWGQNVACGVAPADWDGLMPVLAAVDTLVLISVNAENSYVQSGIFLT